MGLGGEAAMHLREGLRAEALTARCEVVTCGDGEVAQGGHGLSGRTVSDAAAIFVIREVAAVVEAILDGPMGAQGGCEGEFAESLDGTAGDGEDGFGLNGAVVQLSAAVDAGNLGDMGERQFVRADGASLNGASFDAAVAFFMAGALRGKKPAPGGAGRNVRAERAGCP